MHIVYFQDYPIVRTVLSLSIDNCYQNHIDKQDRKQVMRALKDIEELERIMRYDRSE